MLDNSNHMTHETEPDKDKGKQGIRNENSQAASG
jgi:hypothetical protein